MKTLLSTTVVAGLTALSTLTMNVTATAQCGGCKSNAGLASAADYTPERKDIVDTAVGAKAFSTLVAAVKAAGLVDALKGKGPFTVFAPTDEAFAKLKKGTLESLLKPENKKTLQSILTYHVVPTRLVAKDVVKATGAVSLNGQRVNVSVKKDTVKVDGAKVLKTDILCSNGVIHVIDRVILPANKNIVESAIAAPSFKTLVAAVKAAGLVEPLMGKGPFTVLAPTNSAFDRLPAGTLDSLLKPANRSQLQQILKMHVIPGRIFSEVVVKGGHAKTLAGNEIEFIVRDGKVFANGCRIIRTDINASNGVIHVLEDVIVSSDS